MKGTITITLEDLSFEETERCREIIHTMFYAGVFGIKNGKAILSFNNLGLLVEIELQVKQWKRKIYQGTPPPPFSVSGNKTRTPPMSDK